MCNPQYNFSPTDIQIDGIVPEGILFLANGAPMISWQNPADFVQSAWQIVARGDDHGVIWDSGVVKDSENHWRLWRGKVLQPRQCVDICVRVFDADGRPTEYSAPVRCERTLEDNAAWGNANWLWFDQAIYASTPPSPHFRKDFLSRSNLKKARLYITARGVFQASLNGRKISQDLLQPGWVDFRQQIPVVTYDVTSMLNTGMNTIGVVLADGWCCGNLTIFRTRNAYHEHPELLARLELTYEDGETECVVTDASWRVSSGPVLAADLYDGETYDARLEMPGWDSPGFNDAKFHLAAVSGCVQNNPLLVPKQAPPVRYGEELKPVALLQPRKGLYIWDFGQNFAGVFRVRFRGQQGRLFRFQVAEMLDEHQMLYTENYRSAKSEDCYICAGDGKDFVEYTPAFTFHGFRYLQIFGFQLDDTPVEEIQVVGLPMYSSMQQLSDFTTGQPLLNRLWMNAVWGQRSNFLELPTDCPQRDERLGWTGDAQVFAATAMFNMDCLAFFRKYLRDIREAMSADGAAPSIAPAILRLQDGAAGWGDAIVTIPWNLYLHYGLVDVIAENYEAMKRSNAWQLEHSIGYIPSARQFGDWLSLEETPQELVATAYFAYTTQLIANCAKVLGLSEDVLQYQKQAEEISRVFRKNFVDAQTKIVMPSTQCALCMALEFNLLTDEQLDANRNALNEKVRDAGTRIRTGFLGTPLLLTALCNAGFSKTAYDLLLQREYPSWLFPVLQGATTFWERWNSYSLTDGFGDVSMNSFNHYAYGTVARFLLQEIGGIHYRHHELTFKITPDWRFSPVKASFKSPYGSILSEWELDRKDGVLHWTVSAPLTLHAIVILPDGRKENMISVSQNYHLKIDGE